MTVIAVLSSAIAAFLSGFFIGSFRKPCKLTKKAIEKAAYEAELTRLKNEYSNFLNYDGTKQS